MKDGGAGMPKMRLYNAGKGPVDLKKPSGKMSEKGGKVEHCAVKAGKHDKSKKQVV